MIKLLDLNGEWQQARPKLIKRSGELHFSGYQSLVIKANNVFPISENTKLKYTLVKDYFIKDINEKTVADIGCSNMFFGYLSAFNGATKVTGVDLDKEYLKLNNQIISEFKLKHVTCIEKNVTDFIEANDVTIAFAIIHWIYSCSGHLGSLKNVIDHLSNITKNCLYIEWIDPNDDCIEFFKHLDYNKSTTTKDYTLNNFKTYLSNLFTEVKYLGHSKSTRQIYRCIR